MNSIAQEEHPGQMYDCHGLSVCLLLRSQISKPRFEKENICYLLVERHWKLF